MADGISRRDALKHLGAAGAGFVISGGVIRGQSADIVIAGTPVEIAVSSVSAATVRITLRPIQPGAAAPIPVTGAVVQRLTFDAGAPGLSFLRGGRSTYASRGRRRRSRWCSADRPQ
jgi:hypothetical protein